MDNLFENKAESTEEKKNNRLVVKIAGNEYVLRGEEPIEHLQNVAAMVDDKITELTCIYPHYNQSRLAVLASVQLADELIKMIDQYSAIVAELENLTDK
ncbi:MAG: cell division protein ZapA [Clostridia bacterium]|nr:cell division protein ZapA [Clostridia bacterium]